MFGIVTKCLVVLPSVLVLHSVWKCSQVFGSVAKCQSVSSVWKCYHLRKVISIVLPNVR